MSGYRINCDVLRDLVPFLQFKKCEKHHGGVLPKATLLHGCFSRFLNCKNGTKLRESDLVG